MMHRYESIYNESVNDKYILKSVFMAGGPGSGKCLGKGTKVIMSDGTLKAVENIKVGDTVMGANSSPRKVLSITNGIDDLYSINQTTGISYIVNSEHQLSLKKSVRCDKEKKKRYTTYEDTINISVKDWLQKSNRWQRNFYGYKVAINFNESPVLLPPYFVGIWLGDGSQNDTGVTTADEEIKEYLEFFAENNNMKITENTKKNNASSTFHMVGIPSDGKKISRAPNYITQLLTYYNLLGNKHIPKEYLFNSRKIRLELLAGLLDTDGYLHKNCFSIIQKRKDLAEQIKFLADSLGFQTSFKIKTKTIKKRQFVGTYYEVNISGKVWEIPTKIERKQVKEYTRQKDETITGIKIESLGKGEYYGFMLDGDSLFLLEDCTVTHNSYVSELFFGKDQSMDVFTSPLGIKVINSDFIFEKLLKDNSLPMVLNPRNKDVHDKQMALRATAKRLASVKVGKYIDSLLPIIIDGTGKDYNKIKGQAQVFEMYGYDTAMVFVNTSLDVALERNSQRERKVDSKEVEKMWRAVQENIGRFQGYFGAENMIIIDNSKVLNANEQKELSNRLFKEGLKLISKPLKNPLGIQLVKTLRKIGGKYYSDFDTDQIALEGFI